MKPWKQRSLMILLVASLALSVACHLSSSTLPTETLQQSRSSLPQPTVSPLKETMKSQQSAGAKREADEDLHLPVDEGPIHNLLEDGRLARWIYLDPGKEWKEGDSLGNLLSHAGIRDICMLGLVPLQFEAEETLKKLEGEYPPESRALLREALEELLLLKVEARPQMPLNPAYRLRLYYIEVGSPNFPASFSIDLYSSSLRAEARFSLQVRIDWQHEKTPLKVDPSRFNELSWQDKQLIVEQVPSDQFQSAWEIQGFAAWYEKWSEKLAKVKLSS